MFLYSFYPFNNFALLVPESLFFLALRVVLWIAVDGKVYCTKLLYDKKIY